jgi:hypothetical protein
MGVKLVFSCYGKSIDWGCLRTGFWEEYSDLRGVRWRENEGSCTMRKFIICTHSQIKSRQMRCAGHVARMREERKLYKVLVGKSEGKRPLGRPRCRWEDGIRMDLREIGLGGGVWIVFHWLRTATGGGLLWVWWWTFRFLCQLVRGAKLLACLGCPRVSVRPWWKLFLWSPPSNPISKEHLIQTFSDCTSVLPVVPELTDIMYIKSAWKCSLATGYQYKKQSFLFNNPVFSTT